MKARAHTPCDAPASPVACLMINLGRQADRRAHMAAVLASAGVSAPIAPAVDAAGTYEQARIAAMQADGRLAAFGLQDQACTLSHMAALRRFLDGSASHCLILEDDIFVARDLGAWLSRADWWPHDADVVKVEAWHSPRLKQLLAPAAVRFAGREVRRILSRSPGGAGYVISRAAAARVLAEPRIAMPLDHLLFSPNQSALARALRLYQVVPGLVIQGNEPAGGTPGARPGTGLRARRAHGLRRLGQKLRRGAAEVRLLPLQVWQMAVPGARLVKVTYADRTGAGTTPPVHLF